MPDRRLAKRASEGPPRRREARLELDAEVVMRRGGQHCYTVRAFDLTRFGCKVEYVVRPNYGELVWVRFAPLEPVGAFVCWVRGAFAGLEFENPIHPAVFETLLARIDPPKDRPLSGLD